MVSIARPASRSLDASSAPPSRWHLVHFSAGMRWSKISVARVAATERALALVGAAAGEVVLLDVDLTDHHVADAAHCTDTAATTATSTTVANAVTAAAAAAPPLGCSVRVLASWRAHRTLVCPSTFTRRALTFEHTRY